MSDTKIRCAVYLPRAVAHELTIRARLRRIERSALIREMILGYLQAEIKNEVESLEGISPDVLRAFGRDDNANP